MEADYGYPREISSDNKGCNHGVPKHSKKRKFLSEINEQFSSPALKYICYETLIEHDPFIKESQQAKVFYTHVRKGKALLEEVDQEIGADSAHGRSITFDDSLSTRCSHVEPDSYTEHSLSYSCSETAVPRNAYSYFDSTIRDSIECVMSPNQEVEFDGEGNCEDEFDEFGHCLGYLVSACEGDSKQQIDEDFLYMNGMGTTEGSRLSTHQPTIDQEFEDYFSMLML